MVPEKKVVHEETIPAKGYMRARLVKAGEVLRIVDVEGMQVADLVLANAGDVQDRLSCVHTTVLNRKLLQCKEEVIPAKTYEFQPNDVATLYTTHALMVGAHLSEETVYNITKAIVENWSHMGDVHATLKGKTPQWMCDPKNFGGIPLHPGAEKYYKEIGALK